MTFMPQCSNRANSKDYITSAACHQFMQKSVNGLFILIKVAGAGSNLKTWRMVGSEEQIIDLAEVSTLSSVAEDDVQALFTHVAYYSFYRTQ